MSGYKLSGMTQEEYQAMLAWAAHAGYDFDAEEAGEEWEALPEAERARWRAAAEAVRDDTRTEPRW